MLPIFKIITVGDRERALLIDSGRFVRVLEPGRHFVPALGRNIEAVVCPLTEPAFRADWADVLVRERPDVVDRYFTIVETRDSEVAIVFANGKTLRVVPPGKRLLFWKEPLGIRAEVIDVVADPEIPRDKIAGLLRLGRESLATFVTVDESKIGLLFVDNRLVRTLAPGLYAFWSVMNAVRVEAIDLRTQPLEIAGQEILTRDKVSLRVNISAQYRVLDPVKAKTSVKDFTEHLYRALQFAVRQSLGRKTLDEILAEKVDIEPAVALAVHAAMAAVGIEVAAIALKDIVLPGEMRDILNQVVAAEKQAQANLIRRREETAATRSLLNTARLMEENPLLVRLKELETLEKLSEKVERISVTGGFDGLLNNLLVSVAET
jgi:regulator of protease activity HflC (stomatin/prohibitin superfamily)